MQKFLSPEMLMPGQIYLQYSLQEQRITFGHSSVNSIMIIILVVAITICHTFYTNNFSFHKNTLWEILLSSPIRRIKKRKQLWVIHPKSYNLLSQHLNPDLLFKSLKHSTLLPPRAHLTSGILLHNIRQIMLFQ